MSKQEENKKDEQAAKEIKPETTAGSAAMPEADLTTSEAVRPEDLKSRIAELEQSAASLKDQLLRKAAEFENYKKRIESEFATITRFANEQMIVELLPILDDFSRSMKSAKNRPEFESFYRGIELIYTKFLKLLEKRGVKEIDTRGQPFDVDYHEALMEMPKEGVAPHTIIEEVEKGYALHDKVIRHAKVIIAGDPHPLAAQPKDEVELLREKHDQPEKPADTADDRTKKHGTRKPADGEQADE